MNLHNSAVPAIISQAIPLMDVNAFLRCNVLNRFLLDITRVLRKYAVRSMDMLLLFIYANVITEMILINV